MRNTQYQLTDERLKVLVEEKWLEVEDPEYGRRIKLLLIREYNDE